jgi:hypothetical protein
MLFYYCKVKNNYSFFMAHYQFFIFYLAQYRKRLATPALNII